jgi:hypothetical protein
MPLRVTIGWGAPTGGCGCNDSHHSGRPPGSGMYDTHKLESQCSGGVPVSGISERTCRRVVARVR